ncbi:MAG: hypothetical protein GY861_18150 [bacterium]|nr:hypothetical protein [bacterium]
MNYELAKKLKDAGFPQEIKAGEHYYTFEGHPRLGVPYQNAENTSFIDITDEMGKLIDYVKIPTLSELIDACGDGFEELTNTKQVFGNINPDEEWYARGKPKKVSFGFGKTRKEAVAKLWLKLNK